MLSLRKLIALAVCATVLITASTEASDAVPARRLRGEVAEADTTSFNFAELRAGSGSGAAVEKKRQGGRPPRGSFDGSRPHGPPPGSFDGSFGGHPRIGSFDGSRPHGRPPHGSMDGSFGGRPPRHGRPSGSKPSGSFGGDVRELDREGSIDGSRPHGGPPHGSFDGSRPHGPPPGSFDGSRGAHGRPHGQGSHAGKRRSAGSKK